jgi:DNA transformation protein and related proteins
MTRALSSLKGLGPRSEEMLPQVGIHNADDLLAADPYEIYKRLKATVPGTSINALYAIIGAIEDRNWQDIKRERKGEILMRLEDMGLAPR